MTQLHTKSTQIKLFTQVTRANKGRALTNIKAINDPFITPVSTRSLCMHMRPPSSVGSWVRAERLPDIDTRIPSKNKIQDYFKYMFKYDTVHGEYKVRSLTKWMEFWVCNY